MRCLALFLCWFFLVENASDGQAIPIAIKVLKRPISYSNLNLDTLLFSQDVRVPSVVNWWTVFTKYDHIPTYSFPGILNTGRLLQFMDALIVIGEADSFLQAVPYSSKMLPDSAGRITTKTPPIWVKKKDLLLDDQAIFKKNSPTPWTLTHFSDYISKAKKDFVAYQDTLSKRFESQFDRCKAQNLQSSFCDSIYFVYALDDDKVLIGSHRKISPANCKRTMIGWQKKSDFLEFEYYATEIKLQPTKAESDAYCLDSVWIGERNGFKEPVKLCFSSALFTSENNEKAYVVPVQNSGRNYYYGYCKFLTTTFGAKVQGSSIKKTRKKVKDQLRDQKKNDLVKNNNSGFQYIISAKSFESAFDVQNGILLSEDVFIESSSKISNFLATHKDFSYINLFEGLMLFFECNDIRFTKFDFRKERLKLSEIDKISHGEIVVPQCLRDISLADVVGKEKKCESDLKSLFIDLTFYLKRYIGSGKKTSIVLTGSLALNYYFLPAK